MFFRKRRAAKQQAQATARQEVLQDIDEGLSQAKGLDDPGEKILRLKKLEDDIDKNIKETSDNANMSVFSRGFRNGGSVFGGAAIGSIWLAVSFSNPWLLAVIVPGIYVAAKVGGWSSDRMEDRLYKENKTFYADLSARKTSVTQLSNDLIQNDWSAIAKSAKAQEIFRSVPMLREKYAAAFCKGVAEGAIPVPDNKPPGTELEAQKAVVLDQPIGVPHRLHFKKPPAPST